MKTTTVSYQEKQAAILRAMAAHREAVAHTRSVRAQLLALMASVKIADSDEAEANYRHLMAEYAETRCKSEKSFADLRDVMASARTSGDSTARTSGDSTARTSGDSTARTTGVQNA